MFQLAFAKLSSAIVWLQLHHLPLDFWDGEVIEAITEYIRRLLKIDKHTLERKKARYARICLKINLSQLLKQDSRWVTRSIDCMQLFCMND